MRIAMDGREALKKNRTGKGQWAYGFWQELKRRDMTLILLSGSHFNTLFTLFRNKPNLYLSPTSYIVPALIGRWIPCAIVVHDLIAFQSNPHDMKAKWIERLTLRRALKYAKYVFTVSEATKRDLLERFPWIEQAKIKTIYAGSTKFQIPNSKRIPNTKSQISNPYILCVGTLCPRKNQLRLIEAFEHVMVRRAHHDINRVILSPVEGRAQRSSDTISPQLILAGSRGWCDEEIVKKAAQTPNVTWLGHVFDEQYRQLLEQATIFALPSLSEGFGLAVLDAMSMGIPVLTSDRGSLKEIAGDAALYVDPENIDSIAQGLERLLEDENLRNNFVEKGFRQAQKFSWERTADLFLRFIQ